MNPSAFILPILALLLSPLLAGIINRTKAFFAGRKGQSLFQLYYDLAKLFKKGAVYSKTTSWIFRAGPVVQLVAAALALFVLPWGGAAAPVHFSGDLIFLAYLLGLMRFFIVVSALDTGSAFEGMGASREVQFSALAEPALLLGLAAVAHAGQYIITNSFRDLSSFLSLTEIYSSISMGTWLHSGPALLMVAAAFFIVFLAENSRIPFDDPNTHLELTMIHEVMVLDHSGPDLAMILYAASIKMWILGNLLVGILLPVRTGNPWLDGAALFGGMILLAVLTGVVESSMARLRLLRVPQLLVSAGFLSSLALILLLWR
ncbi:respiratory chain complex I subunit 1 family protein [Desulforhabdus amnigena]|jgi:formate hydrogenlyase subunit 4|uniref:Hydrogenase n=1 Tax=Desulforhabdus amnigena TaxID=40218 RepID=A0A9W6CZI0_9BACT|nr:NADH-quinone oxidoreductase subunit H [Desulforhabdus amnigena]GLI34651.1 hydrogenase [Desulforhabdus amnigena]